MSLVLRSFQRSAEFMRTRWSILLALNILPLIDQNEPWPVLLRSKVQVFETLPGTPFSGASSRSLPGTRACCDVVPRTRNCINEALREPVPDPGPVASLRGMVLSRMSWPDFPRKSTTTSARWAGPSNTSCRVTGAGSNPLPVPTWVNAEPSDSAKS